MASATYRCLTPDRYSAAGGKVLARQPRDPWPALVVTEITHHGIVFDMGMRVQQQH
jgi:hypothetical protein